MSLEKEIKQLSPDKTNPTGTEAYSGDDGAALRELCARRDTYLDILNKLSSI